MILDANDCWCQEFYKYEFVRWLSKNHYNTSDKMNFYKFISLADKLNEKFATIKNDCIYASRPSKMNDPFEGKAALCPDDLYYSSQMKELSDRCERRAIVSLVRSADRSDYVISEKSIPLWSHYADMHCGICLEYDEHVLDGIEEYHTGMGDKTAGFYRDVEYLECREEGLPNEENDEALRKLLTRKHISWEYENERRIIFKEAGNHAITPNALKTIYCGCRIDLWNYIQVWNLAQQKKIPCYILRPSNEEYGFECETDNSVEKIMQNRSYLDKQEQQYVRKVAQ